MLPKGPHIVIAALATWRLGAVYVPLFTAFGPEAIGIRLKDANANIVITDQANRSKFNGLVEELCLKMVSVSEDNSCLPHGDIAFSLDSLVRSNAYVAPPVQISCSDDIILLYTSGTTGLPKAVSIPAVALASFHVYMQLGLGLSCGDIDSSVSSCPLPPCASSSLTTSSRYQRYLSTADPAWAYGLYYNLVGPLLIGIPATYLTGPFASSHVVRSLQNFKITHFASSPSAYRAIKADDVSGALGASDEDWRDIAETLQCSSSAGEPLNPEIIRWWQGRMSGKLIADHYGQSEAGMMVNWHWVDSPTCSTIGKNLRLMSSGKEKSWIQVGSMGRSMPGFRLVVLNDEDQEVAEECGQLAVDLYHSPLMWFKGYRNDSERTQRAHSHTGRYYLTGDVVHMEELAEIPTFWYSSRGDDVITSSGNRIGPFDVENCLMGDSRVTE
ncbi:Acsm3, partial [Symbiodinium microadriaticum]